MPADVGLQVAALELMTVAELRARYAEVFGETTQAGPILKSRAQSRVSSTELKTSHKFA